MSNPTAGDSSLLISSGVFQHELTQNFLDILTARANSYLEHLYSICLAERDTSSRFGNYLVGLKDIETWGNDVLRQEVDELTRESPNIKTIYTGVIRRYLADYFKGFSCKSYEIKVPSLLTFVHTFYQQLAADQSVRSMEIFRMYSFNRKYVFMDAMRRSIHHVLKDPVEQVFNQLRSGGRDATAEAPAMPKRIDHRIPSSLTTPSAQEKRKPPNSNSLFEYAVNSAMRATETPAAPDSSRRNFDASSQRIPDEPQTMPSLLSQPMQKSREPPSSRRFSRLTAAAATRGPADPGTHKSIDINSVDAEPSKTARTAKHKHSPRGPTDHAPAEEMPNILE